MVTGTEALLAGATMAAANIGEWIKNGTSTVKEWGGYALVFGGVVLLLAAAVIVVVGYVGKSHGREVQWGTVLVMVIIGAALMVGGWNFMNAIGVTASDTVKDFIGLSYS